MLTTTNEGYRAGRFSLLELADAQLQLIEVEREAIDAAAQFHTLMVEIQRIDRVRGFRRSRRGGLHEQNTCSGACVLASPRMRTSDVETSDEHGHGTRRRKPSAVRTMDDCWSRTTSPSSWRSTKRGIPPEYRVWLYEDDKLLPPSCRDGRSGARSGSAESASASRFVRKANICGAAASSPSRIRST